MEYLSFFDQVQKHLEAEMPFVIYRKPNETSIHGILQKTKVLQTSNKFETPGFVFSPFEEEEEQTIWFYENECEFIETETQKEEFLNSSKKYSCSVFEEQDHVNIVNKAIKALQSEELQKVVISRAEKITLSENQPILWFKHILQLYKNTYCYCWYHPKVGMWLGASPETLISLVGTEFKTMALAGTMPFQGTENVTWGNKEKEEQQLVVNSILNGLNSVTEKLEKGRTTTQKAGNLLHLKTEILGHLKSVKNIKVLIEALHPTSAVCGLPKEKSKNFILANENYKREYYTGYLGCFIPDGNTHLFVNLRCMQIAEKNVTVYVGGGITTLSNAQDEWMETVHKSQIMKVIL